MSHLSFGFPVHMSPFSSSGFHMNHLPHLGSSIHLFSWSNMKKDFNLFTVFIWESYDRGNCHFIIVPMGEISSGKKCLIENAIQNKHRAGKADAL